MTKIYALLTCLLTLPLVVQAQNAISTDRPGEGSNSATVVAKGNFQLESGLYYQHDVNQEGNESTTLLLPSVLVRIGLFNNFELRVNRDYISDGEQLGSDALTLGTKIGILNETATVPAMALQAQLTLPNTGSEVYETNYTQPAIILLISKNINDFLSITTNAGAAWENDDPRAIYQYALSFDMSITDKLIGFIEIYGNLPEGQINEHLLDYGLAYLITPNFQLDVSSGAALTPEATDYFVSIGLAWRVNVWGEAVK